MIKFFILLLISIVMALTTVPAYMLVWGWFVSPTFGIATPPFGLMWGLLIFVAMLKVKVNNEDEPSLEDHIKNGVVLIAAIWLVTGFAKLVHILFV